MKKAVGYDNFLINEAGLNLRQSVRFYLLGTSGSFTVGEAHFASLVESTKMRLQSGPGVSSNDKRFLQPKTQF